MKYTILSPQQVVGPVLDREPQRLPEGAVVAQITDEQAATVAAGRAARPPEVYCLVDGALVSPREKLAAERAAREAARLAAMTPAQKIAAGAAHVLRAGFDADRKVILLNKLLKAKEENTVADFPTLVALYTWMETVQSMAVAGQTNFPPSPHTFEEVIAE